MAAEGAHVVLLERNADTVAAVAAEIKAAGGTAHPVRLDVTDYDRYAAVVADVVAKLGRIDVLVNNAAINPPTATILDDTLEDWRRTIAINLEAVYMGSKLVAPHMVERRRGPDHPHRLDPGLCVERRCRLLQCRQGRHHRLHQVDGGRARPLQHPGQCRGAGLHGDADVVRERRRRDRRRPTSSNGMSTAARSRCGRTGYPEDVSGTVVFLASDYCRYMTGQLLVVDGGLMSTF